MSSEEFEEFLKTRRRELSAKGFFALVVESLENIPTEDVREVLESYLLLYSFVDEDRVALYLEQFLHDPNQDRAEFAVLELFDLAKTPGSLAHKILETFSAAAGMPAKDKKESNTHRQSSEKEMEGEKLEGYLQARLRELSDKEFFVLVADMLEKNPSEEARDILENYLLTYSHVDEDYVARYLEEYLTNLEPIKREFAALQLSILASEPDSLAYKILANYLGEDLMHDEMNRALMKRLFRLFPRQNSEE